VGADIKPYPTVDLKFFYGEPHPERGCICGGILPRKDCPGHPKADEVYLSVLDDYEHLPHKTQAICRWAVERGYDYIFKCDTDTAVYVDRLIRELLGRPFEYGGFVNSVNECSGGPGYFLSQRAARIVGNSGNPEHWAEDKWTGRSLGGWIFTR
jgi:hypothetical protein